MGVAPLRSTSIFRIFNLPSKSLASSSTMGARARQGPHHVAQKSTNTGVSDLSTSWSKFESVTSMMPFAAINPSHDAPDNLLPGQNHINTSNAGTVYPSTFVRCAAWLEVADCDFEEFSRRAG